MSKILTTLILTFSLFPVLSSAQVPNGQSSNSSDQIVIVGGGLGGLTTLHELNKMHRKAWLYERHSNTGGRMRAVPNANSKGLTVEAGGQLVDRDHVALAQLTREFHVGLSPRFLPGQSQSRLYFFGEKIWAEPLLMDHFYQVDSLALQKIASDQKDMNTLKEKIDTLSIEQYLSAIGVSEDLRAYFISGVESELGKSVSELTALILFDTFSIDLENRSIKFLHHNDESLVIEGGSQRLTDYMRMKYFGDVTVDSDLKEVIENGDESFELKFSEKGEIRWTHADKLVLAVPSFALPNIKWKLKNGDLPYAPKNLPTFAANSKIFIYFKDRPWGNEPLVPILGTDAQGIHFQAWDGTESPHQKDGVITLYTGVHSPQQEKLLVKNFLSQLAGLYPKVTESYYGHSAFNWSQSYTTADRPGERTRNKNRPRRLRNIFLVGEEYDDLHQGYMEGAVRSGKDAAQVLLSPCGDGMLFFH